MSEAEVLLYHLKQRMTAELSSRFPSAVAFMMEQSRDIAMMAWGQAGGGKQGQDVIEVLIKQISDSTNAIALCRTMGKRKKKT